MREDETFAITKLSKHIGGSFTDGENPPDAYLAIEDQLIAVEITQLIEPSYCADGSTRPRIEDDAVAKSIEEAITAEFEEKIGDGQTLLICICTPISNVRRLRREAISHISEMLVNGAGFRPINILDGAGEIVDSIDITLSNRWPNGGEIIFSTRNLDTSPRIRDNISRILQERISDKNEKCSGPHKGCEYWLLLLSTYWLARPSTMQSAYNELSMRHRFNCIYTVSSSGHVHRLYKRS